MKVIEHYGGSPPSCECCDEMEYFFLSIDHIQGRKNYPRPGGRQYGKALYRWIVKNNFPDGFRILCYNCNCAMGFFGFCPHRENES